MNSEPEGHSGPSLLPHSIDPALFAREEFIWGEEPWVTVHHVLLEPAMNLNLALAAPVTPFAEPFQDAARRGRTPREMKSASQVADIVLH